MVKKVTRNSTGNMPAGAGLGYVYNDELLDEILGEYEPTLGKRKRGPNKAKTVKSQQESSTKKRVVKSCEEKPTSEQVKVKEKLPQTHSNNAD